MMVRAKLPGGIATPAQLGRSPTSPSSYAAARATSRRARTSSFTSCRWPRSRARCASSPTPASRRKKRAATRCATGRAARSPASPRTSRSIRRRTSKRSRDTCCAARTRRRCRASSSRRSAAAAAPTARRRSSTTSASSRASAGTRSASSSSPAVVCRRCAARAIAVEEFVPVAEMFEAADAVVRVFHRIGNRNNKAKARLKWAIDKIGATRSSPSTAPSARRSAPRAACRSCYRRSPRRRARRPRLAQVTQPDARLRRVGRRFGAAAEAGRILGGRRPADPRRHHRRRSCARSPISPCSTARARCALRTSRTSSCAGSRRSSCLRSIASSCASASRSPARTARRRRLVPGRVELQARGHRVARPRRRAHRAARSPPRSRRGGEGSRHQGLGLPARLRPALHRRHRLPGRHAQGRRQARRRSTSSTSAVASPPTTPTSAG